MGDHKNARREPPCDALAPELDHPPNAGPVAACQVQARHCLPLPTVCSAEGLSLEKLLRRRPKQTRTRNEDGRLPPKQPNQKVALALAHGGFARCNQHISMNFEHREVMRAPRAPFGHQSLKSGWCGFGLKFGNSITTLIEKFSIHARRRSANTSSDGNHVALHRPEPLLPLLLLLLGVFQTGLSTEGLFSKGSISRKQVRKSWFPCQAPCHCR